VSAVLPHSTSGGSAISESTRLRIGVAINTLLAIETAVADLGPRRDSEYSERVAHAVRLYAAALVAGSRK
jgi:hypothetical protein